MTTVDDSGLVSMEHAQDYRIQYCGWGGVVLEYILLWRRENLPIFVYFQRFLDLPITHQKC